MSGGYDIKKSGDTIDARTLQGSPYERSHASYLTIYIYISFRPVPHTISAYATCPRMGCQTRFGNFLIA